MSKKAISGKNEEVSLSSTLLAHTFGPFVPSGSRILILGSFPSKASRSAGFFYMHPTNRFYKALAGVFGEKEPLGISERSEFLARHRIALYDVLERCRITGSTDSSIKDPEPADLETILCHTDIKAVFVTGHVAYNLYRRFFGGGALLLPSPSSANAAASLTDLIRAYSAIKSYL